MSVRIDPNRRYVTIDPDGRVVIRDPTRGERGERGEQGLAGPDGNIQVVADYAALRALTGGVYAHVQVRGASPGLGPAAGMYFYDAADSTSADNGGTLIVDADGRRWKRYPATYLTLSAFGVTSAGNEAAKVQAALDAIAAAGGGTLVIDRDVSVSSALTYTGSNLSIISSNGATITQTGDAATLLLGSQTLFTSLTYYDMTSNRVVGDTTVVVSSGDAANFAVGDWVYVRSQQTFTAGMTGSAPNGGEPVAEINRIKSKSSGTLTLYWPLAKEYISDGTYTHGVAVANSIIGQNISIEGVRIVNTYRRCISAGNLVNFYVRRCRLEGRGAVTSRGRFHWITDNRIHITPDWGTSPSGLWRPYYYGCDTGSADITFARNRCSSTATGMVHLHEGLGNGTIEGNTFVQPAADAAATESWNVISLRHQSWNVAIRGNTITNSPKDVAILANKSPVYSQGHKNLDISHNHIAGTVTVGSAIRLSDLNNSARVAHNRVDATVASYSINVESVSCAVLGNVVTAGSANVAAGNVVNGNVGIPTPGRLRMSPGALSAVVGSPSLSTVGGGRRAAWLLDASAAEGVAGELADIDVTWANVKVSIEWTNAGAGTGDVRWLVYLLAFAAGASLNVADTASGNVVDTAPAQDVLQTTTLVTSLAAPAGDLLYLRVQRDATNVADTLANDAALLGVRIEPV